MMDKPISHHYVTVKRLDHYGELAIPTGKTRTADDGAVEAEFILMTCEHGHARAWLRREDITETKKP